MKRLALTIFALLALASPAGASEARPTLAELESEVVCPTCRTTLDQSSSPIAERRRRLIRARIAAGDTKSGIKRELVRQFGPRVVEPAPPKRGFGLLAWLLPAAGVVVAAIVLALLARRWSATTASADDAPVAADEDDVEPELARRIDEHLVRFDT